MTKVNKRNFILTFAAILFAALTALLVISPKTVVKADEPENPVYSNYTQQEQFAVGAKLAGKLVIISGDLSDIDPGNTFFITENPVTFFVCPTEPTDSIMYYAENGAFTPIGVYSLTNTEMAEISATTGIEGISLAVIVPFVSETEVIFTDIAVAEIADTLGLEFFLFSSVGSGNGSGEENNNNENISEEQKPFDLGEWLHTAGDNVSAWLGENVGISVTGGTVLIVGAVIIIVLFRRRRR